MKLPCLAAFLLPVLAFAQSPADSKANLLKNGNFEQFTPEENLWDGVDGNGFLAGNASQDTLTFPTGVERPRGIFLKHMAGQYDAVLEGGNVGRLPMPISVQVADLNKDGRLDLLTFDGSGYCRVYFNSGTPTEPKFTQGEMVPLFLVNKEFLGWRADGSFRACLADCDKSGSLDLVIGTYQGYVLKIKNSGTPFAPEWKQPPNLESVVIPTSRDGHLWGNLMAPAVYDWNKDGKLDLLLGEGGYSANSIHLYLNPGGGFGGAGGAPFSEDTHDFLAYGDGREQLVPAVVDYNGDGYPDLLVGDRLGRIWVYLSEGPWKRGKELKRQEQPISFGGVTAVGGGGNGTGCVAPAAGDLNGDGKFDIIVGKSNGRIAVSYNIGTATEPKFGPLVDLKGEDLYKPGSIRQPRDWVPDFGFNQGNFNGYYSAVTPQEDPEAGPTTSKQVFKFGYEKVLNRVIRKPPMLIPGTIKVTPQAAANPLQPATRFSNNKPYASYMDDKPSIYFGGQIGLAGGSRMIDSNMAILRQNIDVGVLKPNTRYTLSFKVKGRAVKAGRATLMLGGWLIRDMDNVSTVAVAPDNLISEAVQQDVDFSASSAWSTVTKQISLKFVKQNDLNDPSKWSPPKSSVEYRGLLDIRAALNPDEGVLYIDDVKLTPSM